MQPRAEDVNDLQPQGWAHNSTTNWNCATGVEISCDLDDQFIPALKSKTLESIKKYPQQTPDFELEMYGKNSWM